MKFSVFTNFGSLNSVPVFNAVKQGLLKLGHEIVENSLDADVAVIWSLLWHGRMLPNKRIWWEYHQQNKKVLVIEVGSIKRNITWKVGVDGINRRADFGPMGAEYNGPDRANKFNLKCSPWRTDGEHILICSQHDKSEQWKDMPPLNEYLHETIDKIRKYSKRKIIIRTHPRCPVRLNLTHESQVGMQIPKQVENSYDDFDFDLTNCWAVVSESSNPGITAVLKGIPAFVGKDSLAYDVGNTDFSHIEDPKMPDRQQWLQDYAYTEWTTEEIAEGLPFSRLTF
jgi:hypothetical protein